jgi:hypothetical protein
MVDHLMRMKGRKGTAARHVRLYHFMLESAAWQSLDPVGRALYVEMANRYRGSNNGRITFSVREGAALLHVSKATAARALSALLDRGFIVPTKIGAFSLKIRHASEWRLTEHYCDVTGTEATKAFMRWRPELQNTVPLVRLSVPLVRPIGPRSETVNPKNSPHGPPSETVSPNFRRATVS